MINFKDSKDQTPSALAVLGLLLIVGSVIALFLHRSVSINAIKKKATMDEAALTSRSDQAIMNLAQFEKTLADYQWKEKEDLVAPAALALISQSAEANKLKLVSFRPQKSVENDALVQLPMLFTVDGSFASVANMLDGLRKDSSRLAVQQVQFAAQEGETDQVSANVTLYAFLQKPAKKAATTKAPPAKIPSGVKNNG